VLRGCETGDAAAAFWSAVEWRQDSSKLEFDMLVCCPNPGRIAWLEHRDASQDGLGGTYQEWNVGCSWTTSESSTTQLLDKIDKIIWIPPQFPPWFQLIRMSDDPRSLCNHLDAKANGRLGRPVPSSLLCKQWHRLTRRSPTIKVQSLAGHDGSFLDKTERFAG